MALIANIYNPQNQPKEDLIKNFVVRQKEFEMLFADLRKGKMKTPEQHYMIQGQRGMGKTTLLMRVYYEVLGHAKLSKWLIPVLFSEEQYAIRKLYKLWEHLAKYLEDHDDAFLGLFEEMEAHIEEDDYEEICLDILLKSVRKHKKKMLLLLDNFGDLLEKLSLKERQRLREVLITTPELRIVGGSSRVLEHTFDHQEPFFEFFKIVQLEGLTALEVKALMRNLGSKEQKEKIEQILKEAPARIESLRRLSGGVPRTMVLLFEIFVDEETGGSFKDLESLLDRVTPLYKHRMDELKPNQQEIVEVIALNWDGMPVKDIARSTRMESNVVSAQLTQLEKNRIVTKIATSTKNNLYMLSERFFNIWYIMRYGRKKDQCRVKWLTEFLRAWCSDTELERRAQKHLLNLSKGALHHSYAYHMTEALAQLLPMGDVQNRLIKSTGEFLSAKRSEWSTALKASDHDLVNKANEARKNGESEKAIAILKKIRDKAVSSFLIAIIYHDLKDFQKSEEYYLKAAEAGDTNSLNNLGLLYQDDFKDFEKAEMYYLKAAEAGNTNSLNNLGVLCQNEFKDFTKAEAYYLKAIEAGETNSLHNLGLLYHYEFKDFPKAEEYYLQAAQAGIIKSLNNLGSLYQNEFKDFEKAKKYYTMDHDHGNLNGLNGLLCLYFEYGRNKEEALMLAIGVSEKEFEIHITHTIACVALWNDSFNLAYENIEKFINDERAHEKFSDDISLLLNLLLAKEQYHYALRLFKESTVELEERYKPIYYALMHLMRDEFPNEILKMGPELIETVDEVLEEIEQLAIKYA